jgi:RNA-directed DNA polymerase
MTKQKKLRHLEYYDLQEEFDKLYADSQSGKVFNNLMELISNENNIKMAYRNIKRNGGSNTSGVDKVSIKDIEILDSQKYVDIIQRKLTWYKPKPVKRVEIPKSNGKTRPLGIPTMIDRLVQQCILQVLEPICEAKFHERSNGFRPNRSAEHAMAQCYRMIQKQYLYFVVDIDIKGFFDNVNHSKLIKQMWYMGIRDKTLLSIIKEMLKAPIVMPDGSIVYPTKGTPQGGILSPLLSNIVLNELDWWITSQWEDMPTHNEFTKFYNSSGTENKSYIRKMLRKTNLKEMYIVRYADDFKIFCRTKSDADKIFIAVKQWLKERLKLDISEEKSKVVNLKKHYSEFLGFKLKAVKKRENYVVYSNLTDKAIIKETVKLKEQIKRIQHANGTDDEIRNIKLYNSMVWGIHNYYRYATNVTIDCRKIQFQLNTVIKNRLGKRVKKNGTIARTYIREHYGDTKQIRFISSEPFCPIGYIQKKNPMYKKRKICKYTAWGREEIHKNLKFNDSVITVIRLLGNYVNKNRSIEYCDNRISLYSAQCGRCAVTGKELWIDELHCHHKMPVSQGGTDKYQNLLILHEDVHRLIHATAQETINAYLDLLKPTKPMLVKINKYRIMAGNSPI